MSAPDQDTPPEPPLDAEAAQAPPTEAIASPARLEGSRRLRRDRRLLLTRREDAVYHLGGLAFELYRRGMLPEGVMRTKAGEVAQLDDTVRDIDVRLGEVERARRERSRPEIAEPAVGACLACRTAFRAEARYCWQCGAQVVPPPVHGDDQVTAVISSPSPG
jgi:hypothetical protein